jgi:hypothetical protein
MDGRADVCLRRTVAARGHRRAPLRALTFVRLTLRTFSFCTRALGGQVYRPVVRSIGF